ncbi:hypothetical protein M3Y99_00228800 [Aphelenchoides fujianensis]|nr:hypothetical protein M3Y99_00228800 [Aphelenchoides fujianensis]
MPRPHLLRELPFNRHGMIARDGANGGLICGTNNNEFKTNEKLMNARVQQLEQENCDLRRELAAKDEELQANRREIDELTEQLQSTQKGRDYFRKRSKAAERAPYRTISQLTDDQWRKERLETMRRDLGPDYVIVPKADLPQRDLRFFSVFRRYYRLTRLQYDAIHRNTNWPSFWSIGQEEERIVDECGGFTATTEHGPLMVYAKNPEVLLQTVIRSLMTEWTAETTKIDVVISADKGGDVTKMGFYVATKVEAAHSPRNFVLAAAYEGAETRELLALAGRDFFTYMNRLHEEEKIRIDGRVFDVNLLFVGDFKMVPILFGLPSTSTRTPCPFCLVVRHRYHIPTAAGLPRTSNPNAILKIPLTSIVAPPLHVFQGLINTVLKTWPKPQRKRLFGAASVPSSWQESSLLTGRDGRKLLDFLETVDAQETVPHRPVLSALHHVGKWTASSEFNTSDPSVRAELEEDIKRVSTVWRAARLPTTPKLHVLECHVADQLIERKSWGRFSEESTESLHRVANVAQKLCIGKNKNRGLEFFFRCQLVLSTVNLTEMEVEKSRKQRAGLSSSAAGPSSAPEPPPFIEDVESSDEEDGDLIRDPVDREYEEDLIDLDADEIVLEADE